MNNLKVLKKLQQARKEIKSTDMKKEGYNSFSKYKYFTPEQIDALVFHVSEKLNLFNKYTLERTEHGLVANLQVVDLDSGEVSKFGIATEIPEIKATNIAQQLGGAVTYSERYLLMIAYDIKDNNLDFDTDKKPTGNDYIKGTSSKTPTATGLSLKPPLPSGNKEELITKIIEFTNTIPILNEDEQAFVKDLAKYNEIVLTQSLAKLKDKYKNV